MTFLETRKEASKFLISLVKTIFSNPSIHHPLSFNPKKPHRYPPKKPKTPFKMQFTTILFSLLASTTLINAAPIPDGGITAGVITAVGVACAFQAEQCQKIGDGVKNGVVTVVSESGAAKVESAREDGGVIATIGDAIGGVMGGVKA
ncbi:hypothetical protein TWF225_008426 [Orbilia oligospora]|nr:hypothetical protein TWF225_008426 [Orbilia oligospora]KAF3244507.1 hypothetical protein TWF217_010748 [Orbilia oligospora]